MAEKRPALSPEFEWQKQRIKHPDKVPLPGCGLVRGYGPQGSYSLFLPTPRDKRILQFKGGKPIVTAESPALLETDDVRMAREAVFKSASLRDAATVADFLNALQGDINLAAYSAALLALNYALSDADLTFLHSGRHWIGPIMQHAIGGKETVETLRKLSPETLNRMVAESERQLTQSLAALQAPLSRRPADPNIPAVPVEAVAALVANGEVLRDDDELDLSMD